MATTRLVLLNRINSLCASAPFSLVQAGSPFDFDSQPTGQIDQVFRVTAAYENAIGGLAYSSDQTDLFTIWVARKQKSAPQAAYRSLVTDVTSLTAVIIRDGASGGGDYHVPDGGGVSFEHDNGREYAVARLSLLINYEVQL